MKKNEVFSLPWGRWSKHLLKMKLVILFCLVMSMQLSAKVFSQNEKLSLQFKNASLSQVLEEIEKLTDVTFLYRVKEVSPVNGINLKSTNETLDAVLKKSLTNTKLKFKIVDKTVVITRMTNEEVLARVMQQAKDIKGQVVDKNGSPLPGVSVVIKGTSVGVSTDIDGKFNIKVQKQDDIVLVFSFVGMETKEVKLGEQDNYKVILEESASELEEVVVTGYQKVAKQRMTGSVETVTADKIADKGYLSVEEALQGQMTGVSTMKLSGRPGAGAQIRIRGMNTLTGNAEPIWIVDGMPMQGDVPKIGVGGSDFTNSVLSNGIGNISVDDIESITVLKDAAASAIYGSRAANGVIVVTTKRGRAGKSYLNIRSSFSVNEAPENNLEMMNTQQKIAFENSIYNDYPHLSIDGGIFQLLKKKDAGVISADEAAASMEALSNINTDWYNEIFRTAYAQNHSFSLQGGDEKTQFYASLNYQNETGVVPNNEYSNYGGSLKLTHDFNEKFRINFDLNANYKSDKTTASLINPVQYATYANPYERPYDENGNVVYDRSYSATLSAISPGYQYDLNVLEDINNNTTKSNYINAGLNLKLEYEFVKGLMFATQASLSSSYTNDRKILMPGSYSSERNAWITSIYSDGEIPEEMNNGYLRESNAKSLNYTWRNTISYNKYLNEDHFINVMAGQEISNKESRNFFNVSPEYDPVYDLTGVPDLNNVDGSKVSVKSLGGTASSQNKTVSFFSTATYSYKDKYVFSASGRFDGVDIVGTNNRFTPLWNTSFKYNIHKEEFMRAFEWINILSFRASYGYTGSIDYNARPFPVLSFNYSSRRYDGNIVPSNIGSANPSIKWQKKTDRNLGVDFALFNNRFSGVLNYYNNVTKDLLDTKQIAYSTGRPYIKANVASLRNEGLEFSFNTVNIDVKDFRWTTNFNVTFNKNRVLETYYKGLEDLPTMSRYKSSQKYFIEGNPTQSWYGYKFAGVDPSNGHMLAYIDAKDENGKPVGHKLDNGKYAIDMDSEFRKDAVQFLGDAYPTFTGGFGTGITYKRINLRALFTYMGGHKIKSFRSNNGNPLDASRLNTSVNELYRWRKNGDITNVPAFVSSSSNAYNRYFFDTELEDGDFVKLSNLTLSYNLPINLCSKLKLTRMTLGFSANNLYTWTKYKGIDPETMGAFGYPSARRYSFNLNIGI